MKRQADVAASSADRESELAVSRDQLAELGMQLELLRKDVRDSEERLRFRDILGGIGFICGLAGVAFYMKALRSKA